MISSARMRGAVRRQMRSPSAAAASASSRSARPATGSAPMTRSSAGLRTSIELVVLRQCAPNEELKVGIMAHALPLLTPFGRSARILLTRMQCQ